MKKRFCTHSLSFQKSLLCLSLIFLSTFSVFSNNATGDKPTNNNHTIDENNVDDYLNNLPSLAEALSTVNPSALSSAMPCGSGTWSTFKGLPQGVNKLEVLASAIDPSGGIYVGGRFTVAGGSSVNRIAKWDGSSWSDVGGGMNNDVWALAVDQNGLLYAGGSFTTAGGNPANYIAVWNGSDWLPVGNGIGNNSAVFAIAIDGANNVYAGGSFSIAGGVSANNIAFFNGFGWTSVGIGINNGTDNVVKAIEVSPTTGRVYVGGDFEVAGGQVVNHIAIYDGAGSWFPIPGAGLGSVGVNNHVNAISIVQVGFGGNDIIFAGGEFNEAGGIPANAIAAWDGSSWSSLGTSFNNGVNGVVNAIDATFTGNLSVYVGGFFSGTAGPTAANNIAIWDGSNWSAMGNPPVNGMDDTVNTISALGNIAFAGGRFDIAGDVIASRIAFWNSAEWEPLGSGMGNGLNDRVNDIAIAPNGNVYAVGSFEEAGGVLVNYVGEWDGTSWSGLGSSIFSVGVNGGIIQAVEVDQNNHVYVGGNLSTAGGVGAQRIAKWDGTSWSPMGDGFNNIVYDIDIDSQGDIYAGGSFTQSGLTPLNRIARWNGSSWQALGSGIDSGTSVRTIYSDGQGRVYAGGSFSSAGGSPVSNIAVWNGASWSALGSGLNAAVYEIIEDAGGTIFAGGAFTSSGITTLRHIASFDGNLWSQVGSGFNNDVRDILFDGAGDLYAGGSFTMAGNTSTNRIAKFDGTAWLPLGSAVNNGANLTVYAIELDPQTDKIYVGGDFTLIEGDISAHMACFESADAPPTAVCMNISINLDATGMASITAADVDGGSTDDCGIAGLSIDISNFTCGELGMNTVTLTVEDTAGQTDMCTATVIVNDPLSACGTCNPDTTPPTAFCMDITINLDAAGMATIAPADVDNGSTDNCGINNMLLDQTMFTCQELGQNTVTLTVRDVAGLIDDCMAIVTVTDPLGSCGTCNPDVTFPIAQCMDISINLNAAGVAMITASDIDNGSTDNCGIADISIDIEDFDCMNTATNPTTVTLTVEDTAGNTATCTADVTVNDPLGACCNGGPNMPPVAGCVVSITVPINGLTGTATITPQQINNGSSDDCGIQDAFLDMDTFTCNDLGPNTVTFTVVDGGGLMSSCTAIVIVTDPLLFCGFNNMCMPDITPPVAICLPNITINLDQSGTAVLNASDIDNGSFDLCSPVQLGVDPMVLTCADAPGLIAELKVVDQSNNASSCMTQVEINDPFGACCPSALYVQDDPIPSGLYKATINVFSDKTVPASNVADFRSGQEVNLLPGFESMSGATFHAYISPCN